MSEVDKKLFAVFVGVVLLATGFLLGGSAGKLPMAKPASPCSGSDCECKVSMKVMEVPAKAKPFTVVCPYCRNSCTVSQPADATGKAIGAKVPAKSL